MSRWKTALLLPLALLLGGCVTYPTYSYRDDGYGREVRYVGDDSYYAATDGRYGDYYHGGYSYSSGGYRYYAPDYVSYSAYYSLFWPLHRSYHDPYWHPGFHYGVTYFPRNYFSVSFASGWRSHHHWAWGWGYPGYSAFYGYSHWYSPYRNSWADSYYDWDRARYWPRHREHDTGHGRFSTSLYAPRYGNARNQAERLAWRERELRAPAGDGIATGIGRGAGAGGYAIPRTERDFAPQRAPSRGADYRGGLAREPVQTQGFGVPVRPARSGVAPNTRTAAPSREAFGSEGERWNGREPGLRPSREVDARDRLSREPQPVLRSRSHEAGPIGRPAAEPLYRSAPSTVAPNRREYARERESAYDVAPRTRSYREEPQPRLQRIAPASRDYAAPAARSYDMPQRPARGAMFGGSAEPAPRAEFRSAPAPRMEAAPAPRFEAPARAAPSESPRSFGGGESERGGSRAREALQFE